MYILFKSILIEWDEVFGRSEFDVGYTFPVPPFILHRRVYFYGRPRSEQSGFGVLTAFPPLLWGLILATTVVFTGVFMLLRSLYAGPLRENELLLRENSAKIDVFFKVAATLTEPEGVNIFPKWSTGNFH